MHKKNIVRILWLEQQQSPSTATAYTSIINMTVHWFSVHWLQVEMENQLTSERLEFLVNRWLCDDEDDGDVVRELPVRDPEPDPKVDPSEDPKPASDPLPLPQTRYKVAVMTGDKFGAGTDASVFITLYGEKGDSGKRGLRKNVEDQNKFESGKVRPCICILKAYMKRPG